MSFRVYILIRGSLFLSIEIHLSQIIEYQLHFLKTIDVEMINESAISLKILRDPSL